MVALKNVTIKIEMVTKKSNLQNFERGANWFKGGKMDTSRDKTKPYVTPLILN